LNQFPPDNVPVHLLLFLQHVHPELSSFSLHIQIEEQDLVACLRFLPSLGSLLVKNTLTDVFCAALGAQHQSGDFELCPRLSTLKVNLAHRLPTSSLIVSVIAARWNAEPHALKHAQLGGALLPGDVKTSSMEISNGETTESEMFFRRCVREGLSLHLQPVHWPDSQGQRC